MIRSTMLFLTCISLLRFSVWLSAQTPQATVGSATAPFVPFAALRGLTQSQTIGNAAVKLGYSPTQASNIGFEIVNSLGGDSQSAQALAPYITNEHLSWQAGQKRGFDEGRLVASINHHLGVEKAPIYLNLRLDELRTVRVALNMYLPNLNGGISKASMKPGTYIVGPEMSPFEAFLALGFLIRQKASNDNFLGNN